MTPKDPLLDARDYHAYGGLTLVGIGGLLDQWYLVAIGAALWVMGTIRLGGGK